MFYRDTAALERKQQLKEHKGLWVSKSLTLPSSPSWAPGGGYLTIFSQNVTAPIYVSFVFQKLSYLAYFHYIRCPSDSASYPKYIHYLLSNASFIYLGHTRPFTTRSYKTKPIHLDTADPYISVLFYYILRVLTFSENPKYTQTVRMVYELFDYFPSINLIPFIYEIALEIVCQLILDKS